MTGRGYLVLLVSQAAGEAVHGVTGLPLSGPMIGMVLLLSVLSIKRGPSRELRASANALLGYLSLLFVPAAVGVMPFLPLLRAQWLPIGVALAASSVVSMASAAWIVQSMSRRTRAYPADPQPAEPFRTAGAGQ